MTFVLLALLACPKPAEPDSLPDSPGPTITESVATERAQLQLVESWPSETTLDQPDIADASDIWLEMINGAQTSLDIGEFYVSPNPDADDAMDDVLTAIEAAAGRGVAVRLIADAKFQKTYPDDLERLGKLDNIEVRIFDMKPLTGGVMHAKYFIVDGSTGYLGSQNMDWRSLEHIQELGVRFTGPAAVAGMLGTFERDWKRAIGDDTPTITVQPMAGMVDSFSEPMWWRGHEVSVQYVASPKDLTLEGLWDLPHLLKMIEGAQTSIRIQLLSYAVVGYDKVEWRELDDALRAAGARGVAVQLLVSNWQKSKYKQGVVKELTSADGVEVKFINVPEHSSGWIDFGRTIHSKFMVVDGQVSWVGTSNWSKDYFHGSRNVGLIVSGPEFAQRLDTMHSDLWASDYAEAVNPETTYMAPYEVRKAAAKE